MGTTKVKEKKIPVVIQEAMADCLESYRIAIAKCITGESVKVARSFFSSCRRGPKGCFLCVASVDHHPELTRNDMTRHTGIVDGMFVYNGKHLEACQYCPLGPRKAGCCVSKTVGVGELAMHHMMQKSEESGDLFLEGLKKRLAYLKRKFRKYEGV